MVWNGRIPIGCRVKPDFVAPRSLPGKFESEPFEATHHFSMTEARESSHSSGYHDGEFVLSFNGRQRRRTLTFSPQLDQPPSNVTRNFKSLRYCAALR